MHYSQSKAKSNKKMYQLIKHSLYISTTEYAIILVKSNIIVTEDYLYYKKPKSPYNFFLLLILNELFKFKTSDERQH